MKRIFTATFALAVTAIASPAQTLTTLFNFDYTDGAVPVGGLMQATDGNLYGTTFTGGAYNGGAGSIFKITPSGVFTSIYSFCDECAGSGIGPQDALCQGADGNLYGTTVSGGAFDRGTVFQLTQDGTLTTLHSFCAQSGCPDGADPYGALVQAINGDFYGTASTGGAYEGGSIFRITASGEFQILHSFCAESGCTDGLTPDSTLVQAADGDLYGTTNGGGNEDAGTVFKITLGGAFTTIYRFCEQTGCPDGMNPNGLMQAANGNFYSTAFAGGTYNAGSVFEISPSGTLTTLHNFCAVAGCQNGAVGALVQGSDGSLYGTTEGLFTVGGSIFKIAPDGSFSVLAEFDTTNGAGPFGVIQSTNGEFYGATETGGSDSHGTIFSLSVGLGPLVQPQTSIGAAGSAVKILGTDFTGATSVTFNGAPATFEVASSSLIVAQVPAGAASGRIQVVTPSGTLTSSAIFHVLP